MVGKAGVTHQSMQSSPSLHPSAVTAKLSAAKRWTKYLLSLLFLVVASSPLTLSQQEGIIGLFRESSARVLARLLSLFLFTLRHNTSYNCTSSSLVFLLKLCVAVVIQFKIFIHSYIDTTMFEIVGIIEESSLTERRNVIA